MSVTDWIRAHEPAAYGLAAMTPEQFAAATPREVVLALKGAARRREDAEDLAAWQAATILSPFLTKPVTPDQLLGRRRKDE